jgi:hypothetical protein
MEKLEDFNYLIDGIQFTPIKSISDKGRVCYKENDFQLHVFKRDRGFGIELRPTSKNEKEVLRNKMLLLNSEDLLRNDGVFYPWSRHLSTDKNENKKRIIQLLEIIRVKNYNELGAGSKLLLKGKI